jgi:hypothetical protein
MLSFTLSAQVQGGVSISAGQVLLPDTIGFYQVATAAERTLLGRRAEAIALTSYSSNLPGGVEIQEAGTLDASLSGLGVGTASWVRCSTTGTIERFTPVAAGTSDVIGKCETDGRVHLEFGVWTEDLATSSGGGGGSGAHVAGGPGDIQVQAAVGGDLAVPSFWTFGPNPATGNLASTYQANSTNGGGITFRGTGGDVSGVPNIGTLRYSDQLADNGGFNSITIAAYYRSSGAANVQQGVFGISGGSVFLGDASNPLTPLLFYSPSGVGVTFVMGSTGDFYMTGSHYGALGGADKFLAIDNTGKVTVATPAGASSTGASGTVQLSDGAGGFSAATNVLGGTSFLSIGTTPSTTGNLRLTNVVTIRFRNAANTADLSVYETDSSNNVYFGTDASFSGTHSVPTMRFDTTTSLIFGINGVRQVELQANNVILGKPVIGNSLATSPWSGCNGTTSQAMLDANQTLAAASYANTGISTSGAITANRTLTFPSATDAQGYLKWLNNTCTGAFGIIASTGAGTTITVANGKSAFLWFDSRGVTRMTADV